MTEIFGLGIEHEFMIMKESGDQIQRMARPTEAGGYRSSDIVFTNRNRIVNTNRTNLDRGEKGLVTVATDPTVDDYLSGYELGTMGWQRGTVEKQINKLRGAEKIIIETAMNRHPGAWAGIFPFGTMGAQNNPAIGSYHFTITFPYDRETGETARYREKLRDFVAHLQWAEPLLFAITGGASPLSIGDAGDEPEGSIRLGRNSYGNPGGTNPQALARGTIGRHSGEAMEWQRYVKYVSPKFSTDADVSTSSHSSTAVEIRVFDQFSSDGLKDFLKTIFYIASNAIDRDLPTPDRAGLDIDWSKAMAKVVEEGYNAYLPKDYVAKMKRALKLNIDTDSSLRAVDLMEQVEKELWEKNKEGAIARTFIENRSQPPKIHNFNRDGWNYFLKRKLRTTPSLKSKFLRFVGVLSNIDTQASQGWISVGTNMKSGVRHVLNEKLGTEFSAEDTRDITDFLELIGVVEIKRNSDGSISQIKLGFHGNELKDKVNAAIENKDFYQTLDGIEPMELERLRTDLAIRPPAAATSVRGGMAGQRVRLRRDYPDDQLNDQFRLIRDNGVIGTIIGARTGFRTRPDETLIDVRWPDIPDIVAASLNSLEIVTESPQAERTVSEEDRISARIARAAPRGTPAFRVGDTVRNFSLGQEGVISRIDMRRGQYIIRRGTRRGGLIGGYAYTRWSWNSVRAALGGIHPIRPEGGKYQYRSRKGPGWYSTKSGRLVRHEVKRHIIAGRKGALRKGQKLRKKRIREPIRVGDFEL